MGDFFTVLIVAAGSYAFFVVYAWQCGDRILFQRRKPSYRDDEIELRIAARDGTSLAAIHLIGRENCPTILYLHGNGEDLGDIRDHLQNLRARGFSVFSFDYRGYGATPGFPDEANLNSDTAEAYEHLTKSAGAPPESIIVYGRSLGSGPAIELATHRKVGALVVEGGFISAYRAVTQIKILPMDRFENVKKIVRVTVPVLVIHAVRDSVIPFRHGRQLYAAANEPKFCLWSENGTHAGFAIEPEPDYWPALDRLAEQIGLPVR